MADTYKTYPADGVTAQFSIPFTSTSKNYVYATVDGEQASFSFVSPSVIELDEVPPLGTTVRIYRETKRTELTTRIPASGTFTGDQVNAQSQQVLDIAAEAYDALQAALAEDDGGQLDAKDRRIVNVNTPDDDTDAANKVYVDTRFTDDLAAITSLKDQANSAKDAALQSQTKAKASETASAQSAGASEQSATNSETSAGNSEDSAVMAAGSAELANQFANADEDVEVQPSLFSAKHFMLKAKALYSTALEGVAGLLSTAPEDSITDTSTVPFNAEDGSLKKSSWSGLKDNLKAYFDPFYANQLDYEPVDKAGDTMTGTLTVPIVRLTGTGDASETSTDHAFQIGPDSGSNMTIDPNEIMARANGELANFYINSANFVVGSSEITHGGNPLAKVYTGSSASTTSFPIGHVISALGGYNANRNESIAVYIYTSQTFAYTCTSGQGSRLSGTWRGRGRTNDYGILQRTA